MQTLIAADHPCQNRMLLRESMLRRSFRLLTEEWRYFTMENGPYPDTFCTFPVSDKAVPQL